MKQLLFLEDRQFWFETVRVFGHASDHVTAPKTLLEFSAAEGADAHCHVGAQRLTAGRCYDWLDENLAR